MLYELFLNFRYLSIKKENEKKRESDLKCCKFLF